MPLRPSLLFLPTALVLVAALADTAAAQSFAAATTYSTGLNNQPLSAVLGDVNKDGKLDIITASSSTGAVSVLLGNGNGTFQPAAMFSTAPDAGAYSAVTGDANGDGKLDIISGDFGGVGVLLGNGDGTFQAVKKYTTGTGSSADRLAASDVNGDGKLDIVTANVVAGSISVLLGSGNGTFGAATSYSSAGMYPSDVAVSDFNADGKPDLVTVNYYSQTAGVFLGNGNGTFQAVVTYSTGAGSYPTGAAVSDLNGDGKPDIITANYTYNAGAVGVLLGNGNGTFQPAAQYFLAAGTAIRPYYLVISDVNSDGKLDVVTANNTDNTVGVLLGNGNGNGTLRAAATYSAGSNSYPDVVAVGDVNGDNRPDIVSANNGTSSVGVLLNTTVLATQPSAALGLAQVALYPNPTPAGGPTLLLAATGLPTEARTLEAALLNAVGQVVGRATLATAQGAARTNLATNELTSGMYLLRLTARDAQGNALGNLPTQRLSVQ